MKRKSEKHQIRRKYNSNPSESGQRRNYYLYIQLINVVFGLRCHSLLLAHGIDALNEITAKIRTCLLKPQTYYRKASFVYYLSD